MASKFADMSEDVVYTLCLKKYSLLSWLQLCYSSADFDDFLLCLCPWFITAGHILFVDRLWVLL